MAGDRNRQLCGTLRNGRPPLHRRMVLLDVSGLVDEIGRDRFFSDKQTALKTLTAQYGTSSAAQSDDAKTSKQ